MLYGAYFAVYSLQKEIFSENMAPIQIMVLAVYGNGTLLEHG
jgi:hypothetical protein